MLDHGRNVEFHLFAEGQHGLSLATDLTAGSPAMVNKQASVWFELAMAWLAKTLGGACQKQLHLSKGGSDGRT